MIEVSISYNQTRAGSWWTALVIGLPPSFALKEPFSSRCRRYGGAAARSRRRADAPPHRPTRRCVTSPRNTTAIGPSTARRSPTASWMNAIRAYRVTTGRASCPSPYAGKHEEAFCLGLTLSGWDAQQLLPDSTRQGGREVHRYRSATPHLARASCDTPVPCRI